MEAWRATRSPLPGSPARHAPGQRAPLACGGRWAVRAWLGATLALTSALPAAAAGEVRVNLAPPRLALGETTQLTISVERSDLGPFRFSPHFELDNLEIVGGPSRRESMSWVNGNLSRSYTLTWFLAPQHTGRARVQNVEVVLGDQKLVLPDQEAMVDEARAGPPQDASPGPPADPFAQLFRDLFPRPPQSSTEGPPEILLRAEVAPLRPWTGQQLLYTLYLLAERRAPGEGRVVVETIFPRRVPAFQGFWSQEVQLPESQHAEIVELDGKLWWRQAILQRALFAYEPGSHTIEGAEADLRLVYLRPVGFGLGEEPLRPAAVRRQSNPIQLAVQALPAAPPGFAGAVGQLRARAQLLPGRVKAGEAAVLTAELRGGGNLSGLPDPTLPPMPGIEVSPPQESSRQSVQGTRVDSTRTWIWTLVPKRAGQWRLPPLEWVSFDPATAVYQTVRTRPLELAADAAPPAPPPVPAAPAAARTQRAAWHRPVAWAVGGAAGALLLATAIVLLLRFLRRDRHARRQLLAQVTAALGDPHPRQAAGAAEEAWRSFLGSRYDLPAEAPPTHWAGLLAKRGLGPSLAGELVRLVDDLHYLRYAPRLASTDSLQQELIERSRRLVRRLR